MSIKPGGIAPAAVILSAPYSGAPVLAAMLGRHPELCAVPELNLSMAPSMQELLHLFGLAQAPVADGLYRTVARLAFGARDDAAIASARGWLEARASATTADVLRELAALAAPRRLVVLDTECALRPNDLLRMAEASAPALLVHLVRHPWSQGCVAADRLDGRIFVAPDYKDHSFTPPCLDPQLAWLRAHRNIERWVTAREPGRRVEVTWERLIAEPTGVLGGLCERLGVAFDRVLAGQMLDYEGWEFWGHGPRSAPFGLDSEVLEPMPEALLDQAFAAPRLGQALPWRPDGSGFAPEVTTLARQFGYA